MAHFHITKYDALPYGSLRLAAKLVCLFTIQFSIKSDDAHHIVVILQIRVNSNIDNNDNNNNMHISIWRRSPSFRGAVSTGHVV